MSGSVLKLIACLAMLIDHMAAFLPGDFMDMKETLFMIGDKAISLRMIMHYIGRTAFPLFAFLITEGFIHTHDRKKYAINLLIFALISEIPWNLAHTGHLFYGRQNVFFTLLLGYLGLCAIDYYKDDYKKTIIALACLLGISIVLRADYTCFGFGFIILLHILRDRRLMAIIGCCVLPSRWIGGLAFIPILMYNGQRGFAKRKWTKYAFYIFYPLHLLVLYLIRTYILL
jgi:hypothetical protein